MTGYVESFIPALGRGVLRTDAGERLEFSACRGTADLRGGDLVEIFRSFSADGVTEVSLLSRWSDILDRDHRPLINRFHVTVRIAG